MLSQSDGSLPQTIITIEPVEDSFDRLPNELVIKIMLELNPQNLSNLAMTCRRMYALFDSSMVQRGKNQIWPMLRDHIAENSALRAAMQDFLSYDSNHFLTLLNRVFGGRVAQGATTYFLKSAVTVPEYIIRNYSQLSVTTIPGDSIQRYISDSDTQQQSVLIEFVKNLHVFTDRDLPTITPSTHGLVDIAEYLPEGRDRYQFDNGYKHIIFWMCLSFLIGPPLIVLGAKGLVPIEVFGMGVVATLPGALLVAVMLYILCTDGMQMYKSFRMQQRHQQLFKYFCNKLGIGEVKKATEITPLLLSN